MNPTIIIDIGTRNLRIGMGGEKNPFSVFPTIVSRSRYKMQLFGLCKEKDTYVGKEAIEKRGILNLKSPIERGITINWDDWEKIIHQSFYYFLKANPEENYVLLTEPFLNPKTNQEKTTQIIFETFSCRGIKIVHPCELTMYASGNNGNGVVVDVGDGLTQIMTFVDGYNITNANYRMDFGGRDVSDYLMKLLNEKGYFYKNDIDLETVYNIKEKLCFLKNETFLNKNEKIKKFEEKKYFLPDGNSILISDELFKSSEILFNPYLCGSQFDGISTNIFDSISKADPTLRKLLFKNIILSGGCTTMNGFDERLSNDLSKIVNKSTKVEFLNKKFEKDEKDKDERKILSWKGASILSALSNVLFKTKEEYDECGPCILTRKIF